MRGDDHYYNGSQCCKCQTNAWINRIVLCFMLFVIRIVLRHFLFSGAIDFCRYLKPLNCFSDGWVCSFVIHLHISALCVLVASFEIYSVGLKSDAIKNHILMSFFPQSGVQPIVMTFLNRCFLAHETSEKKIIFKSIWFCV